MVNSPNLNQAKALDPATEQLIYQVVQAFLKPAERGECRCHWIDPQKTPILVWKSTKINSAKQDKDTLIMKINQQKLIGLARSDKNNELYWKFRDFYEAEAVGGTSVPPIPRKEKVETPSKSETESGQVNFPAPTEAELAAAEQSEQVKKFREKYGSPAHQSNGSPNNPERPTGP